MSEQFKKNFIQIFQKEQQKLTDRLWKAYQISVQQIQDQFKRMEEEIRSLSNILCSQQFNKLISNIQQSHINSISILDSYSDIMAIFCFGDEKKSISSFLKKQRDRNKLKMSIFNRQIILQQRLQQGIQQGLKQGLQQCLQQNETKQILDLLNDYDTRPKLFHFCTNHTSLNSQNAPQQIQAHLDSQIRNSLYQMIDIMEKKIDQYRNIYSYSMNEPDIDQLFDILKNQYNQSLQKIQKERIIHQQVLNMKQIYQRVRATLQQKIYHAKQKQNQNYKKINPNFSNGNPIYFINI